MAEAESELYCPVCGTCGYAECCGLEVFLLKHVKGKTNCQYEDMMIRDIIIFYNDYLKERKGNVIWQENQR